MYDVIIVGAGPAGLFAANKLSENNLKVLIVDKGRDIEQRICPKENNPQTNCNCNPCNIYSGLGGAGGKSDGKLNFHAKIGGNLFEYTENPEKYINMIDKTFSELSNIHEYATSNGKAVDLAQKALQTGQQFIIIKQKHIGSDQLYTVMQKFKNNLKQKQVEFNFLTIVENVIVENNKAIGITTNKGNFFGKHIILAPGREGSEWFQQIATKNNIELTYLPIDIGVRVETLNEITKPITDIQYDPKIRMLYRDELIRNFCTNPEGFVVTENYGNYCLVNGHAEKNRKSKNCNFAVLYRVNLTKPRTNTSEYGKHIAQMFNYLGRKKPIVQRLSDLKLQRRSTEERIKKSNVEPTLKDAIPGDITLAMPQKIIKGLLKYLEKLDELMPGIYRGNNTLIYAPEIKFQAMRGKVNKNLECSINNLFLAGDGCGQTGGIVQAGVTGILAAEGIIMKNSLKITLCGKIGSGKSVVAKAISKELNLKHYSTGDLMREIATQKGYKLTEYMKIRPDDIDKIVDEKTKKIGETETNFIFDSKLAFNFIPKSKKIFLDVTDEEAAKRIFENQRESETKVSSIQEMVQKNKTRWEIDRQKYIKMYNVDINDQNNYDIYIDTTNLTLEQVIDKVKKAIQ